jgi:putative tryptophan/tyrosine transport system substrate-binding protein
MRRRDFMTLLGGAAVAWLPAAIAEQSDRLRRIGFLSGIGASDPIAQPYVIAFQQGLHDLGWMDGHNVRIDYRFAAGVPSQMQTFAKELVKLHPDVIFADGTPMVAALLRETRSIPIVFVAVSDPVGQGFIPSIAKPGGNLTGFTNFEISMGGKWLELLKEIAPHVVRVALLFNPDTAPYVGLYLRSVEAAAPSFSIEPFATPVHHAGELEGVVAGLGREGSGAIVMPDIFTTVHRAEIIELLARHRLPAIYPFRFFGTDGGLICYGVDLLDLYRRAVPYIDRILKGAKPGDLPVQAPNKFALIINLKTARALGITIPPPLLARADEVIE